MKKFAFGAATAICATVATANDFEASMRAYLDSEIAGWTNQPVLISEIVAQNRRFSGLTRSETDTMDAQWRAEVGASETPTIAPVLSHVAPEFLRDAVEDSGGVITEVFLMDAGGLNVASSHVTSDYWQGDEAKYQMTFPKASGAARFGEVEFDESSQRHRGQISRTLTDPATGQPIDAMTIDVDADSLL